jgi:hypothetical protein
LPSENQHRRQQTPVPFSHFLMWILPPILLMTTSTQTGLSPAASTASCAFPSSLRKFAGRSSTSRISLLSRGTGRRSRRCTRNPVRRRSDSIGCGMHARKNAGMPDEVHQVRWRSGAKELIRMNKCAVCQPPAEFFCRVKQLNRNKENGSLPRAREKRPHILRLLGRWRASALRVMHSRPRTSHWGDWTFVI